MRPVRVAGVMIGLALSALTVVAMGSAASERHRLVPCSEAIDGTKFPYLGSNKPRYRYPLVLGVVSAPWAYHEQIVRNGTKPWPYFFKAGLIIRMSGQSVVVTVPSPWSERAAIAWGDGGKGVFSSLRFAGCGVPHADPQGLAYSGGFYVKSPACVPLTFRVGRRSATIRFGLGRRCG